jgi:hypothetical protein
MSDFPRLLYRGAADDTAETLRVETEMELAQALDEGWRRHRRLDLSEPVTEDVVALDAEEPSEQQPSGGRRKKG